MVGDETSIAAEHRPHGGYHVPVSGELERGGDVDRLVGLTVAGERRTAAGQEGELRVVQAQSAQIGDGQRPVVQSQPAVRRVERVQVAVAGDVGPAVVAQRPAHGIASGLGAGDDAGPVGEEGVHGLDVLFRVRERWPPRCLRHRHKQHAAPSGPGRRTSTRLDQGAQCRCVGRYDPVQYAGTRSGPWVPRPRSWVVATRGVERQEGQRAGGAPPHPRPGVVGRFAGVAERVEDGFDGGVPQPVQHVPHHQAEQVELSVRIALHVKSQQQIHVLVRFESAHVRGHALLHDVRADLRQRDHRQSRPGSAPGHRCGVRRY